MELQKSKIDQLLAFRNRDKFSDRAWNDRGLNPSSMEVSATLNQLFNNTSEELINAINDHASENDLKAILKERLNKISKNQYDTEEREFIADYFSELSKIININFTDNLTRWLYGTTLYALLKIKAVLYPEKIIETQTQPCNKCGASLDTFIIRKEEGIPDFSWKIVRCKSCMEYSIIDIGPNIKEVRFGNYELIEQLPKEDFTREQAEIRLEQIRHFRK